MELYSYAAIGLAGGAAAFAHCLGMCGGLALHLSQYQSPQPSSTTGERVTGGRSAVLGRQLLWHAGKTVTYAFLGAMAGLFGGWVGSSGLTQAQNVLAYVAGGLMIVMGLALLGLLPTRRKPGQGEGLLASLFRQFVGRPTGGGALALGLATGFLPCPIVLGFLALAAQSGSVLTGLVTLAAVGVGTVWALLLLGLTGQAMTLRLRRRAATAAALVLVLAGTATVLRGTETFHHLLGCPVAPAIAQPETPAESEPAAPCCSHPAES
jgi:uncharacterized protein